jgi:hypothetical protein
MSELTSEEILAAFDRAMRTIAARFTDEAAVTSDIYSQADGDAEAVTPISSKPN